MIMEKYIGKQMMGFLFNDTYYLSYSSQMDLYLGQIGTIKGIKEDSFIVEFKDGCTFRYPCDESIRNIVNSIVPEYKFTVSLYRDIEREHAVVLHGDYIKSGENYIYVTLGNKAKIVLLKNFEYYEIENHS